MNEIIKIVDGYKIIELSKTNIIIIENILEDEFCDEFIKLIDKLPLTKNNYKPGNNTICYESSMNELLEMNDEFYYFFDTNPKTLLNNDIVSTNNLNGLLHEIIVKYNLKIFNKVILIQSLISQINSWLKIDYIMDFNLRKIYGKTRCHTDGIEAKLDLSNAKFIKNNEIGDGVLVRNASIIFSLNDNYEGGTFRFPYQDVFFKLKKGSVVIFPPFWTHPHETDDLENKTYRYTINTWSCEKI